MALGRREFGKMVAGTGIGSMLQGALPGAYGDEQPGKPNILFIMTDQQHAGMMSCTGNRYLKTPALDGLAQAGIRFEKAYCANPVCMPSRTSMATGVMPCRLGADNNGSKTTLPPDVNENSMGKIMQRAGYATFYGGKVHMCAALSPKQAGYDEYVTDDRDLLPDACLNFITTKRDKPFFAVASFINPHDICFAYRAGIGQQKGAVADLYAEASALPIDQLPPLPENFAVQEHEPEGIEAHLDRNAVTPALTMRKTYDEKAWRIYRWIYHRLTEKVDRAIGQILDGLKKSGLEQNTLILFTSDHGNMDASHRLASKSLFYEESVRVPLILKCPGAAPGGRVDGQHLVSTGLDLLPTLCDYAGVEKPDHLLGASLRPLAEGRSVDHWRNDVASENGFTRMIRSERYKYLAFVDAGSKESLVDLEKDPGEMKNLVDAPDYQSVLVEYRKRLAEWSAISKDQNAAKFAK